MNIETKGFSNKADSECVNLLLVGETNVNRNQPEEAFANVMDTLLSADVLFGHMECPLTATSQDPNYPDIPYKPLWKFSDPSMVKAWTAAGFAAVGCASNVMFGSNAVKDTLNTLDSVGIQHCGVGLNYEDARKPAIVERKGVKFGFLSYTSVFWPVNHAAGPETPGVATIKAYTSYQPHPRVHEMPGGPAIVKTVPDAEELAAMERDILSLREKVDIIVMSCHWGVSSSTQITDYQKAIAHTAINAGVDIIIGHHPHLPQGIEIFKGKPIFYSMGNFAFDWAKMKGRHLVGIIVRCTIRDKRLAEVSFVPAKRNQDNLITVLDPSMTDGKEIFEQIALLSSEFETQLSVEVSEIVLKGIAG